MSRIGNNPISIPDGVTVTVADQTITVKGKLGELTQEFDAVSIEVVDGSVSKR
jgi:large subunit ribosomal protein L6